MTLRLITIAAALLACGGSSAKPAETPAPASPAAPANPEPRQLPEYPGGETAGMTMGPDGPITLGIVNAPVETVRSFYSKERLQGFDVIAGNATTESPLHVRDAAGKRDYLIAVYPENGITMIRIEMKTL
jgi:hypothetical protein